MSERKLLEEIIRRIEEMPKVSDAPYRLLQTTAKNNYSMNEIVKIVETDVSLTAQCLKVVNSAAFSLPREISSLQRAVVLLGTQTIIKIALSLAFKNVFTTSMKGYKAEKTDFWDHSFRTAIASRILASENVKSIPPDMAYTAGLLHNIGKAIISEFLERFETDLLNKFSSTQVDNFLVIENEFLGTDHTKVGEAMAKKWKFPESLQQVIRYHHDPMQAKEEFRALCAVVHVADLLAMMSGAGTGFDGLAYGIDEEVKKWVPLERETIPKLIFNIDLEYLATKKKFNIFSGDNHE